MSEFVVSKEARLQPVKTIDSTESRVSIWDVESLKDLAAVVLQKLMGEDIHLIRLRTGLYAPTGELEERARPMVEDLARFDRVLKSSLIAGEGSSQQEGDIDEVLRHNRWVIKEVKSSGYIMGKRSMKDIMRALYKVGEVFPVAPTLVVEARSYNRQEDSVETSILLIQPWLKEIDTEAEHWLREYHARPFVEHARRLTNAGALPDFMGYAGVVAHYVKRFRNLSHRLRGRQRESYSLVDIANNLRLDEGGFPWNVDPVSWILCNLESAEKERGSCGSSRLMEFFERMRRRAFYLWQVRLHKDVLAWFLGDISGTRLFLTEFVVFWGCPNCWFATVAEMRKLIKEILSSERGNNFMLQ